MEDDYLLIKAYKLTDHLKILHPVPNYESKAEILSAQFLSSEIFFFSTAEGPMSSLCLIHVLYH